MSDPMKEGLARLTRVAGVRGAVVVDADAGVPVASELRSGVSETALAALAGSLYRRSMDATTASGLGRVHTLQLEASGGHIVVVGTGGLLVVTLAEAGAQLGMVRVQTARVAGELTE